MRTFDAFSTSPPGYEENAGGHSIEDHVAHSVAVSPGHGVGLFRPQHRAAGRSSSRHRHGSVVLCLAGRGVWGHMCAVLMAFDGVSKDRASGMLEVRLAQPMPDGIRPRR